MSTALPRLSLPSRKDLYIALTAPAIAYLTTQLIRNLLATTTGTPPRPHIHHAPPTRLLTAHEEATVPYPPDALPGGRNVATPYGRIRAYEWGPARGRKVLFVHGISTPCIALARLAKQLVRRGCRVLLFDLPGRGYSDCVDPAVYRQDAALFSSLMLAVVATSPFNWTDGFSLVGYSLGGGIAADFCSWYPDLVESLVLIAPGGLVRPTRLSVSSKILYSGVLPDWMVNYFVGKRLRPQRPSKLATSAVNRRSSLSSAVQEELPEDFDPHAPGQDSLSPIFDDRPSVSPATAVAWQVDVHPGFIPAFISCIKYAPIHDGFDRWRLIGQRCEMKRAVEHASRAFDHDAAAVADKHAPPVSPSTSSSFGSGVDDGHDASGLDEGKVLVLLGLRDVIIMADETSENVVAALGKENVEIVKIHGGHDLVLSNTENCVRAMAEFWESSSNA